MRCGARCDWAIEGAVASAAIAVLSDMPIRWNDDEAVGADAVRLTLALDHPVYDCVYLAIAIASVQSC
ncbi:MAG: type II toxin-antitoxin system VapC family toxin [Gammaproteobacteria bacterium]|nr:type II toxin-antitoxin system VapC family toxin [Gammaproteobacteria bacterium]